MHKTDYGCSEYNSLSRRRFLSSAAGFGAGSFFGLLDPRILYAQGAGTATAKNVILLWMAGGQSHIDTWDPHPGTDTGGPFEAIDTAADGIQISQHLPLTAEQFKHLSLIRSMTSREGSHERATYLMHTGYAPLGSFQHSTLGSVVTKMTGKVNPDLPAYVSISGQSWKAGFLGSMYAPFHVNAPTQPLQNLSFHKGVDAAQFNARLDLLSDLDESFATSHRGIDAIQAYAEQYQAALRMMMSESAKAFDLEEERPDIRERYGKNGFGQGCLLARRLVQAGVRFIEVTLGGWDTHQDNFDKVKELSGTLDNAVSALIADLNDKGLLNSTMVILTSEFGRTPRINGNEGRDHWPRAWSCLIGGGGVQGGRLIGKTTLGGHEVAERPIHVGELHATICHALAIDTKEMNYSPDGRPIRVVKDQQAEPIRELFA